MKNSYIQTITIFTKKSKSMKEAKPQKNRQGVTNILSTALYLAVHTKYFSPVDSSCRCFTDSASSSVNWL